jgi:hypothetical protein
MGSGGVERPSIECASGPHPHPDPPLEGEEMSFAEIASIVTHQSHKV